MSESGKSEMQSVLMESMIDGSDTSHSSPLCVRREIFGLKERMTNEGGKLLVFASPSERASCYSFPFPIQLMIYEQVPVHNDTKSEVNPRSAARFLDNSRGNVSAIVQYVLSIYSI